MIEHLDIPKFSIANTMFDVYNDKDYLEKYNPLAPYCLRTPANLKPKCTGCGNCTPTTRKVNLSREVHMITLEDLYGLQTPKVECIYRIVYKIPPELKYQKKVVLDTFIAGQILSANEDVIEHSLGIVPISELGLKDKNNVYSGLHAFDMKFTKIVNLTFPALDDLNIHISETKMYQKGVFDSKLISIYVYNVPITFLNKFATLIESFKTNPQYSKYTSDRDGQKVVKIRYNYAESIKLIKKDKLYLIFPMDGGEHPLELLRSLLRMKEIDIITKGELSRMGLFQVDKNPSVCSKHKHLLLQDIFGNNTNKCVNCVLGV